MLLFLYLLPVSLGISFKVPSLKDIGLYGTVFIGTRISH